MNTAPQRPEVSRDGFLQTLTRSRLLPAARVASVASTQPELSARGLADYLISTNELTHYQAEKLLQGLWQGLVLGPYQVLAPIGRGGMGTVYLARDSRLAAVGMDAALIALKVLPAKRAREEERTLHRFRREMELGRHVEHPNITRTLDAGEVHGIHYIAMEYVPGHSLRQVVAQNGPLSVPDAARVFADVIAGLHHAHKAGLIHRDLKPSNIMVTPEGRGKVLDFGLALLMGEALPADPSIIGGQGYILGTMDYIAPEQSANSTDVGPWSDLYAVGCSMYFALTGAPPFPGGTSQQKIRWHRTEDPPPVNLINPAVPVEFARLIEKLMAKEPAERPQDAEMIRGYLLRVAGEPVVAEAAPHVAHTASEVLAEVDTRTLDPNLWDSTPLPVADEKTPEPELELEPLPEPKKRSTRDLTPEPLPVAEEDDPDAARRQLVLIGIAAVALPVGLILLALVFVMLLRLL